MTGLYAEVIGDPISHSKSPLIHNFWLERLGIAAEYRACHVRPDALAEHVAKRRDDPKWVGCNVTLPHKQTVMDYVDDPGEVRGSIGAMNTIFRDGMGGLIGTNTDAAGFLSPIMDLSLDSAPVVLIGSGGAAHAILYALSKIKAGPVTILARNQIKAAALLARFGLKGVVKTMAAAIPPARLLVNASPLGMAGQLPLDIDLSPLPKDALVYDIVYAPLETRLLADAHQRGLQTVDGLEMLIGQAAIAFEMFFGAPPPIGDDGALRALLTQ